MREAVAGGRRRRLRGDRLPRATTRRGGRRARARRRELVQVPGRAQHDALRAARGRGGDRALELPARDPDRDDRRGARGGQRGRAEAGRAVAGAARWRWSRRCTAPGCRPTRSALLPGYGDAGAALVRDPRVHLIAFTGSGAVGLEIVRAAAETPDGQGHVKRVIAEMGGKNCVIVDSDADLDDAVPAIVDSAFGYAGQKCSAAARVLAHEAIAETLLERLAGAADALDRRPGRELRHRRPAADRARGAGPRRRATASAPRARDGSSPRAREAARRGLVLPRRRSPPGSRPTRPLLREEIFGPLLTRRGGRRRSSEALEVVDSLPFALTGGLFSRNPTTIEHGRRARSPVGNLYVNRDDHRGDGRPPAVRRQPPLGDRLAGRRPRLPAPVHRAAGGEREHDAPRPRDRGR